MACRGCAGGAGLSTGGGGGAGWGGLLINSGTVTPNVTLTTKPGEWRAGGRGGTFAGRRRGRWAGAAAVFVWHWGRGGFLATGHAVSAGGGGGLIGAGGWATAWQPHWRRRQRQSLAPVGHGQHRRRHGASLTSTGAVTVAARSTGLPSSRCQRCDFGRLAASAVAAAAAATTIM
jgi:hypothetical protein